MLNLPKCIVKQSSVYPISASVLTLAEGVPLVAILENGNRVLTPCTGIANEYFAGFSENRFQQPQFAPMVEDFTIPGASPYTHQLVKVPSSADRSIYIAGVKATVVSSGPTTGQIAISAGGLITFAAADAGKAARAIYRYALTQTEAILLFGSDAVPFLRIAQLQTSVFEVGTIFTDQYLMGDDWGSSQYAYLGANGLLTTDDTGAKIGPVIGLPGFNNGYLGVEISI